MLRHFAKTAAVNDDCPGAVGTEIPVPQSETEFHVPEITSWKQLQVKRTDAAPAENPAAELETVAVEESGIEPLPEAFVQQLPPSSDVPLANPPAVAAVSPAM